MSHFNTCGKEDAPFRRARADRAAAFSLNELLVVLVLLACLVAVIFPVIGMAVRKSDIVRCAANLRTMGVATLAYAGDHGGVLPGPVVGQWAYYTSGQVNNPREPLDPRALLVFLVPYLGLPTHPPVPQFPDVATCPAAKKDLIRAEGKITKNNAEYFSMAYTVLPDGTQQRPFGYNASATLEPLPPMKLMMVKAPHDTVAMTDQSFGTHGGTLNVLFIDGHVEALTETQVVYTAFPSKSRIRIAR